MSTMIDTPVEAPADIAPLEIAEYDQYEIAALAWANKVRERFGYGPIEALPRGDIGISETCVLARALPAEMTPVIGSWGMAVHTVHRPWWNAWRKRDRERGFVFPTSISVFVHRYDLGNYPHLVRGRNQ